MFEKKVGDVVEIIEENGVTTKINRIPTAENLEETDTYESTILDVRENNIKFLNDWDKARYITWDELKKNILKKYNIRVTMHGEGSKRYFTIEGEGSKFEKNR